MKNMTTRVRILGPKLFRHDTWRVLINGEKWLYDHDLDCFIARDRHVVDRVDMPLLVVVAFHMAWRLDGRFHRFGVPLPAEGLPKPWGYPHIMNSPLRSVGQIFLPPRKDAPVFEVSACRGWWKRKL